MTRGASPSFCAIVFVSLASDATAEVQIPRFTDRSADLPVEHRYEGGWEHFVGGGVAVFDCNSDSKPDILAAGGTAPARIFVNQTTAPDDPISFVLGPELNKGVTGAWPLDVDSDGHLDIVLLRVGANSLLRGLGDCRFEDASKDWGFAQGDRWSTAFSATWEPGATWPTLAVGNYVNRNAPDGPFGACDDNELHRPGPGGYGLPIPLTPGFCALSMLISDWQRGGRPELRISNDRHYYIKDGYEEMWRLSPLRQRDASEGWPRVSLWGMGIASGDINGDGLPEVMLTSMGDQLLQLNMADHWQAAPFSLGTYAQRPHVGDDGRPSTGWHAEFGDVNNDGRLDLFIAKGNVDQMPGNAMTDPNNLLIQGVDGQFGEAAVEAGIATTERARGAALADFDRDGNLDLVVVNRRAPMEVWQNTSEISGGWLSVSLEAPAPNRRAVGAWLEVDAGDHVMTREITVGGGHGGGQAGPVHFGLGSARTSLLRVIWPDGTTTDWQEVPAQSHIRMSRRPDGTTETKVTD